MQEMPLDVEVFLGGGEFVEKVLEEADGRVKYQLPRAEMAKKAAELIEEVCRKRRVDLKALRFGSRRREVSRVRRFLAGPSILKYLRTETLFRLLSKGVRILRASGLKSTRLMVSAPAF